MGVQGSGKGTQAAMLAEDLDLVHISVGDIFRWNVQHHTKLGAQVRRTMAGGGGGGGGRGGGGGGGRGGAGRRGRPGVGGGGAAGGRGRGAGGRPRQRDPG